MRPYTKQKFLRHHTYCCFCGGLRQSTELDHQPAESLFREWTDRHLCLVFPACSECNRISHRTESALPLILPVETEDEGKREQFRQFVGKHMLHRRSLVADMLPSNREKRNLLSQMGLVLPDGQFLSELPILTLPVEEWRPHITMLARKLTLALHYRYAGRPLPPDGRLWFTHHFNFDALNGRIGAHVQDLLSIVTVDDEISFGRELSIGHVEGEGVHAFAISLRDRLLILSFSSDDPQAFDKAHTSELHGPFVHAR